jgi:hypothetical protein
MQALQLCRMLKLSNNPTQFKSLQVSRPPSPFAAIKSNSQKATLRRLLDDHRKPRGKVPRHQCDGIETKRSDVAHQRQGQLSGAYCSITPKIANNHHIPLADHIKAPAPLRGTKKRSEPILRPPGRQAKTWA